MTRGRQKLQYFLTQTRGSIALQFAAARTSQQRMCLEFNNSKIIYYNLNFNFTLTLLKNLLILIFIVVETIRKNPIFKINKKVF